MFNMNEWNYMPIWNKNNYVTLKKMDIRSKPDTWLTNIKVQYYFNPCTTSKTVNRGQLTE